jgi:hypothetical protein
MRRSWILSFAVGVAACFLISTGAQAQSVYNLGFEGPDFAKDTAGVVVPLSYDCTLGQTDGALGAQGWSISVEVTGADPTSFTTVGSARPRSSIPRRTEARRAPSAPSCFPSLRVRLWR